MINNMYKYMQLNSVLIRHVWKDNSSMLIQTYNNKMETKLNYITDAIKVNIEEEKFGDKINEGDTLFLSRYITVYRKFRLNKSYIDNYDYSSIPAKLILGRFKDGMINLDSLEVFMDKVLIEPLEDLKIGNIFIPNSQCDIGRVVKCGKGGLFRDYTRRQPLVKEGSIVIFWNNVSTPVTLGLKKYACLDDHRLIGFWNSDKMEDITLDNLKLLNGRILLQDLKEEKLDLKSEIILPSKDNDFEISSNPENKCEVVKISERGKEYRAGKFLEQPDIKVGDVLVADKNALQYTYFKSSRYFTLESIEDAEAIIKI